MFLVSQVASFFPYLKQSSGTDKYISVVQHSTAMLSANKTKIERKRKGPHKTKQLQTITDSRLNHKQFLLKVSCATKVGNSLLPQTSVTHFFCCPRLFQLIEGKQPACSSVSFWKALSQWAEKKGIWLSWNQGH